LYIIIHETFFPGYKEYILNQFW